MFSNTSTENRNVHSIVPQCAHRRKWDFIGLFSLSLILWLFQQNQWMAQTGTCDNAALAQPASAEEAISIIFSKIAN